MKKILKSFLRILDRHPLKFLLALLIVLFGIIYLGAKMREPAEVIEEEPKPKEVEVYEIGSVPYVAAEAQVEKQGLITVVAQIPGIVNQVNVEAGDQVLRGQNLILVGSTYTGGSALSLQRQIAQAQYNNTLSNYDAQKQMFADQRELAQQVDANAAELRKITEQSIQETKDLIAFNEEIISSLDDYLVNLDNQYIDDPRGDLLLYAKQMKLQFAGNNEIEDRYDKYIEDLEKYDNIDPRSDLVLYTRQMKSQFLAGLNSLRSGLRQSEYQADEESPSAQISDLQRQITVQQIGLQEKAFDLNLEVSRLQLRLAQLTETQASPQAPTTGSVEHVHIREGDTVSPGMPLITISSGERSLQVVAYIPQSFQEHISNLDPTKLVIGERKLSVFPSHISREAVQGSLYAVTYMIPGEYYSYFADQSHLTAFIPIGYPETLDIIPFVPIDAVYQTADSVFVYLFENGSVASREIELGSIFGGFVEVKQGLDREDILILNRNVFSGDKVEITTKSNEQ